jgi:hypothetical protein
MASMSSGLSRWKSPMKAVADEQPLLMAKADGGWSLARASRSLPGRGRRTAATRCRPRARAGWLRSRPARRCGRRPGPPDAVPDGRLGADASVQAVVHDPALKLEQQFADQRRPSEPRHPATHFVALVRGCPGSTVRAGDMTVAVSTAAPQGRGEGPGHPPASLALGETVRSSPVVRRVLPACPYVRAQRRTQTGAVPGRGRAW